jgi:hypothetical protein
MNGAKEIDTYLENIQLDLNDVADGKKQMSLKVLAFQIGGVREMIERAINTKEQNGHIRPTAKVIKPSKRSKRA